MQPVARRDPALFRHGMSPASKCLIGLSLSAALVALDGRAEWAAALRNNLERGIAPLMIALELPGEAAREVGRGLTTHGELLREIARLEADNERLRTTARSLDILQRENDELRTLAGLPAERLELRRTVQLFQRGRGVASQRFLIGAGTREGIREGMALVHPEGVVGQVVAVGETTADVALITDAGQNTPVELARTGVRAVMVGEGMPDRASLRFLASNADVQPGDLLVTSGLDGYYPAGMAVATVLTVERDAQSDFARVICKPAASVDARRHFAVVVPAAPAPAAAVAPPEAPAKPAPAL
ncbi:MAG: rod shape-determining protein MreC [Rhodocyclaceae bacterium]|nr:rod shape-determining protein MreC [Rhodocyclaceae bacterium]